MQNTRKNLQLNNTIQLQSAKKKWQSRDYYLFVNFEIYSKESQSQKRQLLLINHVWGFFKVAFEVSFLSETQQQKTDSI